MVFVWNPKAVRCFHVLKGVIKGLADVGADDALSGLEIRRRIMRGIILSAGVIFAVGSLCGFDSRLISLTGVGIIIINCCS